MLCEQHHPFTLAVSVKDVSECPDQGSQNTGLNFDFIRVPYGGIAQWLDPDAMVPGFRQRAILISENLPAGGINLFNASDIKARMKRRAVIVSREGSRYGWPDEPTGTNGCPGYLSHPLVY